MRAGLWRHPLRTARARRAWWDADGQIRDRWYQFEVPAPDVRACHLTDIACHLDHQAELHAAAWGPEPTPGQPGVDRADTLRSGARLLRWVALTEQHTAAVAETGNVSDFDLLAAAAGLPLPPIGPMWRCLNGLSGMANLRWRHALASELAEEAAAEYGPHAADELAPLVLAYGRLADESAPRES
jgi:hypothetical protein